MPRRRCSAWNQSSSGEPPWYPRASHRRYASRAISSYVGAATGISGTMALITATSTTGSTAATAVLRRSGRRVAGAVSAGAGTAASATEDAVTSCTSVTSAATGWATSAGPRVVRLLTDLRRAGTAADAFEDTSGFSETRFFVIGIIAFVQWVALYDFTVLNMNRYMKIFYRNHYSSSAGENSLTLAQPV
jgi:hypothetical protein